MRSVKSITDLQDVTPSSQSHIASHHLVPDASFQNDLATISTTVAIRILLFDQYSGKLYDFIPLPRPRSLHGNCSICRLVPDRYFPVCSISIILATVGSDRWSPLRSLYISLLDRCVPWHHFPSVSDASTGWSPIRVPSFDLSLSHSFIILKVVDVTSGRHCW